jgi:hypothetical protein
MMYMCYYDVYVICIYKSCILCIMYYEFGDDDVTLYICIYIHYMYKDDIYKNDSIYVYVNIVCTSR